MENFQFCVPTTVHFGKEQIEKLPEAIKVFGKKVLLTYGGGSIKKSGLFDKVKELLCDYKIYELSGIEPNPKINSVRDGVRLCR
jgi:alcohol dehydrogenase YqhD (iron-dependent ADH family)